MAQRFILNEVSYFGPGARKELPEVLTRMGVKKALVTSDKGLIKVGTHGDNSDWAVCVTSVVVTLDDWPSCCRGFLVCHFRDLQGT